MGRHFFLYIILQSSLLTSLQTVRGMFSVVIDNTLTG